MTPSQRKISHLIVAAAALISVAGVQAQTGAGTSSFGKGYIGLSAGQSDYSLGNGSGLYGSSNRVTAYSVTGGGYFNNNLGVEIGYTDFGNISRGGGTTRAEGINLSLVGKMPVTESFNLLGKIGTTYARTSVSTQPGSGLQDGSENGWGLSLGIGAEYMMTAQLSALLQYDAHDMRFAGGGRDRVSVTSLGLRYRF
mgnify:FL=1